MKIRVIAFVLAFIIISAAGVFPDASVAGVTLLGDVNGDGAVDSLDAALVLRYDAGLLILDSELLSAADCNSDGGVDSLDAATILKYDAGLISLPQATCADGNHSFGVWTTVREASCTVNGEEKRSCVNCGVEEIHIVLARHTVEILEGYDATCTENGLTEGSYCSVCFIVISAQEPIIASGHRLVQTVIQTPTPNGDGLVLCECIDCDYEYTASLPYTEDGDYESSEEESREEESVSEDDSFRTSYYDGEYVNIDIDGNTLTVKGVLDYAGMDAVWIRVFTADDDSVVFDDYVEVPSGTPFSSSFDLSGKTERMYVTLYHHKAGDVYSWSYIDKGRYFISRNNGQYALEKSPVFQHNAQLFDDYIDPQTGFYYMLSPEMRTASDLLVGNVEDDYEIMYTLFKWVSENVYYDYDFLYGVTDSCHLSPENVYRYRYTVCQGYTNLLCALLQAQGIPCIQTECYGQFPIDAEGADATTVNHVFVEAYLESENRWVIMDPTWNSGNRYQGGVFEQGFTLSRYFDVTPQELSVCHKVIRRKAPWFWYV